MSVGYPPCPDRAGADLLYIQLHYEDMVARIAEGKQFAWNVVQWTFALIGAIAGIFLIQEVDGRPSVFWFCGGIVGIGIMGFLLMDVVSEEITAHRICLIKLRNRVMGGWTQEIFGDLPVRPQGFPLVHRYIIAVGTLAVTLALGVIALC